jgi:murein DD-endopeptidase MepM/ murein hydrolase activator NlpD
MVVPDGGGSPPPCTKSCRWSLPFPLSSTHDDGTDQGVDFRPVKPVKAIAAGVVYHHSPVRSYKTPFGDGEAIYVHLDHKVTVRASNPPGQPSNTPGRRHTYYNVYYSEQHPLVTSGHVRPGQAVMIPGADELGFANDDERIHNPIGAKVPYPNGVGTQPSVEGCDFRDL